MTVREINLTQLPEDHRRILEKGPIQIEESGLTKEESELAVAHLKAQFPQFQESTVLLGKNTLPPHLEGLVEFVRAKEQVETQKTFR